MLARLVDCLRTWRAPWEYVDDAPVAQRADHEPRITATWRAASAEALDQIGGWVHDAHFDWELVAFDPDVGRVTIPFQQEPDAEECGQPGPQLIARAGHRRRYRVPFVRGLLTIGHATALKID